MSFAPQPWNNMANRIGDSEVSESGSQGQRVSKKPATERISRGRAREVSNDGLRERVEIHDVLGHIATAMHHPHDVVAAACREVAPFFPSLEFTIAVYFPQTRLLVIHIPGRESKHVGCDETIEGYFLYHKEEDVLAIDDYALWTSSPPLNLTAWALVHAFRSGLFAAARVNSNLLGVVGLQSKKPRPWGSREVEMIRTAALGFGLAYYHAALCDDLIYSCRETSQRLGNAQREAHAWRQKAEQLQTAADIVRLIGVRSSATAVLTELVRLLSERWTGCRVSVLRYLPDKEAFQVSCPQKPDTETIRPARGTIQMLFLNNVPVTNIVCDSPQEIADCRELDPKLVAECEREGFRSFCAVPIYIEDRLWGTIMSQFQEPGACAQHGDLLAEIGRALALPIQTAEINETAVTPKQPIG